MLTSILHRATGVALYGGALILAGWVVALASGQEAFAVYKGLLGSPLGKVVMFGLTVSLTYHLVNGIRHLAGDAGRGLEPRTADATGWFAIIFSLIAAIGVWVAAFFMGAL